MDAFGLLGIAASGMDAQRAVLDIEARNVAAAEAAGPKGSYRRLVPKFTIVPEAGGESKIAVTGTSSGRAGGDVLTEMVAVLNASRAFEANASIFEIGKQLAQRTIEMGRV